MQAESRNKNLGVYMHVIIGKTVEAYKVASGMYLSQGKAGAAILENEDQSRYDLYIYREDQQKITSARIASRFQFEVHGHLYCSFYDNAGISWAIRFNLDSDSTEFIREVALARWKSGRSTGRILVQELCHGDSSLLSSRPDSIVTARYTAAVLNAENKFTPELDGRVTKKVERIASSPQWETVMTNCRINSSRIVILPSGHQLQVPWMDLIDIENGDHLWLQIDIENITPHGQTSVQRIEQESSMSRMDEGRAASKKDEITSRLMKMGGQALVPFPSFPSDPAESLDRQQSQSEPDVGLSSKSQEYVKKCTSSQSAILPPVISTHQSSPPSVADNIQYPPMIHHLPPIMTDSIDRGMMARKESELNMLISEVRTTNSHLCMSIMRMTDKMDNFFSKSDSTSKGDSGLNQVLSSNNNIKSDIENCFNSLSNQNKAIMDVLLRHEKSKSEVIGRIESMQDDMMNTILSMVPKGRNSMVCEKDGPSDNSTCTESTCKYASEANALEVQLKGMQAEKYHLKLQLDNTRSEHLEALHKISSMEKQFTDLKQENASSEEPQAERLMTVKLAAAERAAELLRKRVKELEIATESADDHLAAEKLVTAVKTAMNKAWRALRPVLPNELLQAQVASALREVTKEFIDQLIIQRSPTENASSGSGRFSPSAKLPAIVEIAAGPSSSSRNHLVDSSIEEQVKINTDTKNALLGEMPKDIITDTKSDNVSSNSKPYNDSEDSLSTDMQVKNQDGICEKATTEDVTKIDRPQKLVSSVDMGSEESSIVSPGDGLIEKLPIVVMSPGDGFAERSRPPVPARSSKVTNISKEDSKDLSSRNKFSPVMVGVKPVPRNRVVSGSCNLNSSEGSCEISELSKDSPATGVQVSSSISKSIAEGHEPLLPSRDNSNNDSSKILPSSFEESIKNESVGSHWRSGETTESENHVDGFVQNHILCNIPPTKTESPFPSSETINTATPESSKLSHENEESADGRTYTVEDGRSYTLDDASSDEDMDTCTNGTESSFGLPPYAPLVSSEPPPLSPSRSSSSPSPPPVCHLPRSKSDVQPFSSCQEQPSHNSEGWAWKAPPPSLPNEEENDDDWLFQ